MSSSSPSPPAPAGVSVIIPNYNYARFLTEAVESVLAQTQAAEEILIVDDCSTDESPAVIAELSARHPGRLRVLYNPVNLGIVKTFAKAVAASERAYVAFLGADNRMRPDYVERCRAALDQDPGAGVAYIDMTIFGDLAPILAAKLGAPPSDAPGAFLWRFPEPTEEALALLPQKNFIDGNSMFRRSAYEQVGGFRPSERAEDHDLFLRMVQAGWRPVHVAEPLVEYRQHSRAQANVTQLAARQLESYRGAYLEALGQQQALHERLTEVRAKLAWVRELFRTDTPVHLARTVFFNLVAPHRKHLLEQAVAAARARWRGQAPTPNATVFLDAQALEDPPD